MKISAISGVSLVFFAAIIVKSEIPGNSMPFLFKWLNIYLQPTIKIKLR